MLWGRAEEKKFGDGAGQGVKSSGPGRVTVKLGAFLGWGGAVLKILGPGQGGDASLVSMTAL